MMSYFLLIAYLKMSCFIILRNCDIMFFVNYVFENDIFMYVLQRRLY